MKKANLKINPLWFFLSTPLRKNTQNFCNWNGSWKNLIVFNYLFYAFENTL